MFFAVLAPLCVGPVDKRKRLVFDILRRRVPFPKEGVAPNADVKHYMKFLRAIYLPTQVKFPDRIGNNMNSYIFIFIFLFVLLATVISSFSTRQHVLNYTISIFRFDTTGYVGS